MSLEPRLEQGLSDSYRIHPAHARMWVMAIPRRVHPRSIGFRVGRATTRMVLNTFCLIGFEVLAVVLSVWFSFQIRALFLVDATIPQLSTAIIPIYILLGWLSGLYPGWALGPVEDLRRVSRNIAATFLLITGVLYFTDTGPIWARVALLLSGLIAWVLIPMARWFVRLLLVKLGFYGVDVAVLGAGKTGTMVVKALKGAAGYGLNPVAIYDDDPRLHGTLVDGLPVVGSIASVERTAYAAVFVAMPGLPRSSLLELLRGPLADFEKVLVVPDFFGVESLWVETRDLNGTLTLEISRNLLRPMPQLLKRLFDLVVIVLASPVWLPIFAICAVLIFLSDRHSPIYSQERVGWRGTPIRVMKFRTMVVDAETRLQQYLDTHPDAKLEWETKFKLTHDPRITPIGGLLRRTSLDEIPQLLNVVLGQMSLVGPRPLPKYHLSAMAVEYQDVRARVQPGISGLWQVSGRSETDVQGMAELDDQYVRNWSVWLDIVILVRTVGAVIAGRGAY
jgi:Undecaprenyl-phosphate galactose phosphotransferase WbaP